MTATLRRCALPCTALLAVVPILCAQELAPPRLESYRHAASPDDFVGEAETFLDAHPSSVYAPRVALDLLLVAERAGNQALAERARARLLFEYPQSLQAHHILANFADAKALRSFLTGQVKRRLTDHPAALPAQFTRILHEAVRRFPARLFDDTPFLVLTQCLAEAAGDAGLQRAIRPTLAAKSAEANAAAALARICLATEQPLVERILRLRATGDAGAGLPLRCYLAQLSETERDDPRVRRIGMALALQAHDYDRALDDHAHLPADVRGEAQVRFWRAWAQAATGEETEALATLAALQADDPDGPWAASARSYRAGLAQREAMLDQQVDRLQRVIATLRQGLALLQADLRVTPAHGAALRIGLASDADRNLFELTVSRAERLIVAYRTSAQEARFYLPARDEILRWPKPGPIPLPQIDLNRHDDGSFAMNAQLGFESTLRQAGSKGLRILDSPHLATAAGLRGLLARVVLRGGWVPGPPRTTSAGDTEFRWLRPQVDDPGLRPVTFTVTPAQRITAAGAETWQVTALRYGPSGSFRVAPQPWPERPVRDLRQADPAILLDVVRAVMDLLRDPDEPSETGA